MVAKSRHPSIRPQHFSVKGKSLKLKPDRMVELSGVSIAQTEAMERLAIEIFTDMVNAGKTFQEALGAIYLSGLENGYEATRRMKHVK